MLSNNNNSIHKTCQPTATYQTVHSVSKWIYDRGTLGCLSHNWLLLYEWRTKVKVQEVTSEWVDPWNDCWLRHGDCSGGGMDLWCGQILRGACPVQVGCLGLTIVNILLYMYTVELNVSMCKTNWLTSTLVIVFENFSINNIYFLVMFFQAITGRNITRLKIHWLEKRFETSILKKLLSSSYKFTTRIKTIYISWFSSSELEHTINMFC